MQIKTSRFGLLEFPKDLVINFPGGLLGFPHAENYAVLEHDADGSPFKWLQAVDDPNLAFIIIDPHLLVPDYLGKVEKEVHDVFGPFDPQDISTIAIVTVPGQAPIDMTANLRAPVIIRFTTRQGKQLILTDDEFSLNHRIFGSPSLEPQAV